MKKLQPQRCSLAEHSFRTFRVIVEDITLEEILSSSHYFTNISGQLQQGDEIRLDDVEGQWVAKVYVYFKNGPDVRVKLLYATELEQLSNNVEDSQYEIKMRGPLKWCLVDKESGANLMEGIPTKAEAEKELYQYRMVAEKAA